MPSHTRILVSLAERKVAVQDASGSTIRIYSVYVGSQKFPTLPGQFQLLADTHIADTDPTYNGRFLAFHEYPDPEEPGVTAVAGFHGWKYGPEDDEEEQTNPGWKTTTEGCIQMTDEDIADFATLVSPGDEVLVLDRPLSAMLNE